MIRWVLFSVIGTAALAGVSLIGKNTSPGQGAKEKEVQQQSDNETGTPFAVVELFTSEGCSSCPPADDLLGEIVKDAQKGQQRVYCLSFHVDYWNSLGWRDPYSDPAFSRRQREYARAFKSDQVYTPQMVVNGSTGFVGSDRTRARKQIDAALKQPVRAAVKLSQEQTKDASSVVFAYEVRRAARGSALNVAVVEGGLVSKVKRGENGGRILRHENVVQALETGLLGEAATGTVQLKLPADLVRKNSLAIAYVQDIDTWAILGATAVELQPADPPLAAEHSYAGSRTCQ
ncbi:MAG: DUF1223 domain-containing protein [Planctomycetaceae bacterium]|nr:DUF1223 domain-containing protein [Planctomycetaceae bacterium]